MKGASGGVVFLPIFYLILLILDNSLLAWCGYCSWGWVLNYLPAVSGWTGKVGVDQDQGSPFPLGRDAVAQCDFQRV